MITSAVRMEQKIIMMQLWVDNDHEVDELKMPPKPFPFIHDVDNGSDDVNHELGNVKVKRTKVGIAEENNDTKFKVACKDSEDNEVKVQYH